MQIKRFILFQEQFVQSGFNYYRVDKNHNFCYKEMEDGSWAVYGEKTKQLYYHKLKEKEAIEICDRMNKWK